jgi:hypothetical protein
VCLEMTGRRILQVRSDDWCPTERRRRWGDRLEQVEHERPVDPVCCRHVVSWRTAMQGPGQERCMVALTMPWDTGGA